MAGRGTAHLRDEVDDIVLRVEDLVVEYPAGRKGTVHAVSGVSLDLRNGETLGLVGESGCGKSTTGKAIMQIVRPTSGSVVINGTEATTLDRTQLRATRRQVQMIFQDPISSLNPRRQIADIVGDPLVVWGESEHLQERVDKVLEDVGLDPDQARDRRPYQFSGGQCQRISIARSLILDPKILICDEPVSALDVSIQAQILNLLEDMKRRYSLSMVFIAHNLAVVRNISDRIAVMYLGKICEIGPSAEMYATPLHPYTAALVASIPGSHHQDASFAPGEPPSPLSPPSGCRFRTRCPFATDRCRDEEPQIRYLGDGRYVACHHPLSNDDRISESSGPGSARGRTSLRAVPEAVERM